MNLFILDTCPVKAAQLQCDKHVVKMIVESGQMLSTAHRMCDGAMELRPSKSGKRTVKYYKHPNDNMEDILYKAVHHFHPCTVWTMETNNNYLWHYDHFIALCREYSYRYGKVHATEKLIPLLSNPPKNIKEGVKYYLTQFPLAMKSNPECMFPEDPVKSYRMFYQTKQDRFKMVWSKREVPCWFEEKMA